MNLFSKKSFAIITACSVAAVFAVMLIVGHTQSVDAAPIKNVTGWALSDMPTTSDEILTPGNLFAGRGLGWISMTGTNANSGGGSYAVTVDLATGEFTGRAWSEHGGWLNFSPGGVPANAGTAGTSATSGARVDPACLADITQACAVTGWIRFTGGPADPQSGGWDGWVSMSGAAGRSSYGLVLGVPDTNGVRTFTPGGYAWGDTVAGWINFQWAQVKIDKLGCTDPTATNYDITATASDGSCEYTQLCPDGSLPPAGGIADCPQTCPDGSPLPPDGDCDSNPNPDQCPTTVTYNGITDPKTVGTQTTLPPGYSVQNGMCGIFGCVDPKATNQNSQATIATNTCTYNICPDGSTPVNNTCPTDICRDKVDNNGNGLIDWEDPLECPVKGPKKPIFIET